MTKSRPIFPIVFVLLSMILSFGCTKKDPRAKNLVQIDGRVLLDEVPLENASFQFYPFDENEFVRSASGKSNKNGCFSATSFLPGDGIHPGKYRVAVIAEEITNALSSEKILELESKGAPVPLPIFKSKIPERYKDPETSGIVIEIPKKGDKNIVIKLESK